MTPEENKQLILAELDRLYPQPKPELHFTNPYETLVAVMLSAQCTDKQVNKVTPAVFARFPDVKSMAEADVAELYPLVKSCGFKSKASNIIAACRMILAEDGGEVPHTMEALTRLPGVGRKRRTSLCPRRSIFRQLRWIRTFFASATALGWWMRPTC